MSIAEPPKGAKVDWETLGVLAAEVDSLRAKGALDKGAFLSVWDRGKVAAAGYPAALETLRMLRPDSVNAADL